VRFAKFSFGSIRIDAAPTSTMSSLIAANKKRPSKKFREQFGHTPLAIEEEISWRCSRLVIGSGAYGRLPVIQKVERKAGVKKSNCLFWPRLTQSGC
jgi:hypothetical protein